MSTPLSKEKEIEESVKLRFGEAVKQIIIKPKRVKITANSDKMLDVAKFLKHDWGFDNPASVAGTDYPATNEYEVIYHISCVTKEELKPIIVGLATRIPRDTAKLQSLIQVWRGVEYHEQETYEMLGITFEGHPRMEKLLLPEDWTEIPPLRKEFTLPGRTEHE